MGTDQFWPYDWKFYVRLEVGMRSRNLEKWTVERSAELYGVENWGGGYFAITPDGKLGITPFPDKNVCVPIASIIGGLQERGLGLPVLLRIENLLDAQISLLHASFAKAIKELNYTADFRGVYPVKVNQQQQVLEEIAKVGDPYNHGFEVGSKAELIAALSFLRNPEACLICNGYKDHDYIDLALYACKMGFLCFLVLEMPSELPLILERAKALGIKPRIGVRIKVSTQASGHWVESAGDLSVFGLSTSEVVEVIDQMRSQNMLDCVQLLHFHLGSQIPNIRDIRSAVHEAVRMYAELAKEGCAMGFLDLGGGLAVDYDGSHTNYASSRNYTLEEYCTDIVESVMATVDEHELPHPHIITESGRATVAYYSVLLFNILDVSRLEKRPVPQSLHEDDPEAVHNLLEVYHSLSLKNLQECYNDAIYYRDQIRQLFRLGQCSLRQRAISDTIFWAVIRSIAEKMSEMKNPPSALKDIDLALASIYYCNMSVFQSLPDAWAIDHLFPIMPVHRLEEMPTEQAILADITCDSDGKLDSFIDIHGVKRVLELHEVRPCEPYYLGAFLVGAYQETLGDLHNLFGDTNVVSVRINEDGTYDLIRELEGDSVADVLSYVEFEPKQVLENFRKVAEQGVREGKISPQERFMIMRAYERGLRGYTYLNVGQDCEHPETCSGNALGA
ncbi:biosynthetic arginine decarboxylase [Desulfovibrionales bacterium]